MLHFFAYIRFFFILAGLSICTVSYSQNNPDPKSSLEKFCRSVSDQDNLFVLSDAKPTKSHPLAGYYQDFFSEGPNCKQQWGMVLGPSRADPSKYYFSFCGPNSCIHDACYGASAIDPYRNPHFKVIDENRIYIIDKAGETSQLIRCPNPNGHN